MDICCKSANIGGYRTNHSLRATSASRLYQSNLDEQIICETTGHRSSAVRSYKRTSIDQQKAKSDVLYGKNSDVSTVSVDKENLSRTSPVSVCIPDKSELAKSNVNVTVNVSLQ